MEFQLGPAWFQPLLGPCPGLTSSLSLEGSQAPLPMGGLGLRLRDSSSLGLRREAAVHALSLEMRPIHLRGAGLGTPPD